MNHDYIKIRIDHFPTSAENDLSLIAFDHAASGISEDLAFKQHDLALDPSFIPAKMKTLFVYFENEPPQEFLQEVKSLAPMAQVTRELEPQKDWLEEWKKGFHAFRLVGEYWLVPSWEKSPATPAHTIAIDPGMAFGTGTHATTQMMASLIHGHLKKNPATPDFLDVGCGTGILSILACRLAERAHSTIQIVGLEIDPIAREVARENVIRNDCESVEILDIPIEEVEGPCQFIGANIIDGVLLQMKAHFLRLLPSDGHLLLSGILSDRDDSFIEAFLKDTDLKVHKRLEHQDWVAYHLRY